MPSDNHDDIAPSFEDFRKDDLWTDDVALYVYWFEFLNLSPSYELARRFRNGTLDAADQGNLPKDFDQILSVFDDFGDLRGKGFVEWWRATGMGLCAHKGRKPIVAPFAGLKSSGFIPDKVAKGFQKYIDEIWIAEGCQNTLLVAIPLGLSKSNILKQVGDCVDGMPDHLKTTPHTNPKYSLATKRIRDETLRRYYEVMSVRICNPDIPLWRIGVATKVSETYSPELQFDAQLQKGEAEYDRKMLAILTSRAVRRGYLIAENAARGIFPSYKKCENAMEPNYEEMCERFNSIRR